MPSGEAVDSDDAGDGVLLYYKYVELGEKDRAVLASWMEALCKQLELVGRVRVALDGVNVTLGGTLAQLEAHVSAVKEHPVLCGSDIDFKLAASSGAVNEQASQETGFKDLRVNVCDELVTLGPRAVGVGVERGGTHYSPQAFHAKLKERQSADGDAANTVLLDTRNCYESRIGRFHVRGITLEDPQTRQFSDFPEWVDANAERLRGKTVMMYCTGGVRCERASAYLKSKGDGFEDVIQLKGGIQRYLEAFPEGGFFRGKNFVFDERLAVGGAEAGPRDVVGTCMSCGAATEDYGPRLRCPKCRLLLLVCGICASQATELPLCELCSSRAKPSPIRAEPQRRLKLLCLHGFRQTGKKFQGRTAALRKKLGGLVEFVFIDAPHALPFWIKSGEGNEALREVPKSPGQPKRSWLVSPDTLQEMTNEEAHAAPAWKSAPFHCMENQHLSETEGWGSSWQKLKQVIVEQGPFDGVLGFSQGAGVAAHLSALQHIVRGRTELQKCGLDAASCIEEWDEVSEVLTKYPFKFAWLCSGYSVPPILNIRHLLDALGPITIPALHVHSSNSEDRQISPSESSRLAELFHENCRTVVTHDGGHFIPCSQAFITRYRDFLTPLAMYC